MNDIERLAMLPTTQIYFDGDTSTSAGFFINNLLPEFHTPRNAILTLPDDLNPTTLEPSKRLSRFDEGRFDLIIGDYVIEWMEVIVITILCGVVAASGLVANVINVLVFFRQKTFTSSSNVSLLALAFSDIGNLLPLLGNSINYAIFYLNKDAMPFLTPQDVTEIFFLWPHIMFMQISSWITVYIAAERCLSVVFPLKVRMIFTGKRTFFVVLSIGMILALSFIPIYATTIIEEVPDFDSNATKLIFSLNEDQFEIVDVTNIIQSVILRIIAVTIVFICTQITVYKVRLSTTWRTNLTAATHTSSVPDIAPEQKGEKLTSDYEQEPEHEENTTSISQSGIVEPSTSTSEVTTISTIATSDTTVMTANPTAVPISSRRSTTKVKTTPMKTNTLSNAKGSYRPNAVSASALKERRLIKVITMISTIFVVCNLPEILGILTLIFMENVHGISPWDNLIHMITYVQFFFESINASINIFVYYNMSTNYRLEFRRMFRID